MLNRDTTTKKELYARHGIKNYWVVNLPEQKIMRYSQADLNQATYLQQEIYTSDSEIKVTLNPDLSFSFLASEVLV